MSSPSTFRLAVLDAAAVLTTVDIEASDPDQAWNLAERQGLSPVSCEPASASPGHSLARIRPQASFDSIAFAQDLATLLTAGVTVRDAVHALARRESQSAHRSMLLKVSSALAEGKALSGALRDAAVFPDLMIATILASEQTGDLATGMLRYARHQSSLRGVRDKVVSACIYPLLLLAVSSAVVAVLLGIVVPRFASIIDIEGKQLPLMSRLLMDWGRFVSSHPLVAGSLFAAAVVALASVLLQLRSPGTRRALLERLPGFAALAREFQHLQLYRTTAILTSRGVPLHKALAHGRDLLGPTDQARLDMSLAQMRNGVGIAASLSGAGLSDDVATSMLAVAETTGSISEMLDRVADFYERKLEKNIDLLSRIVEPALMVFFGLLIGALVILMYMPIFDLAATVS